MKQEGERRSIILRYLGEVATAVARINGANRDKLYEQLLTVAKRKTMGPTPSSTIAVAASKKTKRATASMS